MSRAENGYFDGMQIDQDPGDYRVRRADGSWTTQLNKPLMRWLGILGGAMALMAALAPGETNALVIGLLGFFSGAAITLSLKSIDW